MKTETYLNYLHSCIRMTIDSRVPSHVHEVMDFFSTYVDFDGEPNGEPLAVMNVYPLELYPREVLEGGRLLGHRTMRTSTAPEFNLECLCYEVGESHHFIVSRTNTNIVMNKREKRVDIYCSEQSSVQLIELIRDFVVKNEESHGTLILHAAAVMVGERSIVVSGSKGSGKSTLLLEFLSRGDCRLLSGDKLFVTVEDGSLKVKGWPDYPHLGAGTISRHPGLRALAMDHYGIDVTRMNPGDKILIHPKLFADTLSIRYERQERILNKCVFPRFDASMEGARLIPAENGGGRRLLDNLMFSTEYYQTKWHDFIVPDYSKTKGNIETLKELLGQVSFWEFKGNLKIDGTFIQEVAT